MAAAARMRELQLEIFVLVKLAAANVDLQGQFYGCCSLGKQSSISMTVCTCVKKKLHTLPSHPILSEPKSFSRGTLTNKHTVAAVKTLDKIAAARSVWQRSHCLLFLRGQNMFSSKRADFKFGGHILPLR